MSAMIAECDSIRQHEKQGLSVELYLVKLKSNSFVN